MYLGIDIGGTNLKVGLVSETGDLVASVQERCGVIDDLEAFVVRLVDLAKALAEQNNVPLADITAAGIGVPGATEGGTILYTCNMPMRNIPMEALFRKYLDIPVFLANDADCAALGEYWRGAGQGSDSMVFITLGTGIGGGLVLGGKLYRGLGAAGEVGHMVVEKGGAACNCGRTGCWEAYASATGLTRMAKTAMARNKNSLLWELAEDGEVNGRITFEAALQGDATARLVCREYVTELAEGVTNLINLLHPQVLAIGGGISNAKEEALLDPLREIVQRKCYASHGAKMTQSVKATLGNDAGMIGAAKLCAE